MFSGLKRQLTAMRKDDLLIYRHWNSLESLGRRDGKRHDMHLYGLLALEVKQ
ncbi:hypothetical protein [Paenisporosarcina sp. TG20]|uniref:hypothetical protein n=1 Tax=Paenisporosarcina sp. TG20 TaxID=1211706 RepID=UPI000314FD21|nr:hypothetical protein [Paenisporosarcina sp. TG20]